jgi:hypothetical protein
MFYCHLMSFLFQLLDLIMALKEINSIATKGLS